MGLDYLMGAGQYLLCKLGIQIHEKRRTEPFALGSLSISGQLNGIGLYLECTTAGVTAGDYPIIAADAAEGTAIADGTAEFTVRKIASTDPSGGDTIAKLDAGTEEERQNFTGYIGFDHTVNCKGVEAADHLTTPLLILGNENIKGIGDHITNTDGIVNVNKENVTGALGYTPPEQDTTYSAATTTADGLMSKADKAKLDEIADEANKYTLPTATAAVLGGVKKGNGVTIAADGTLTLDTAWLVAQGFTKTSA